MVAINGFLYSLYLLKLSVDNIINIMINTYSKGMYMKCSNDCEKSFFYEFYLKGLLCKVSLTLNDFCV